MQIRREIIPYKISSVTFSSNSKLDSKLELDYFEPPIMDRITDYALQYSNSIILNPLLSLR